MNEIKTILADSELVAEWAENTIFELNNIYYNTATDPFTQTRVAVIRRLMDRNKALEDALAKVGARQDEIRKVIGKVL
jgi:hypothetical protein